MSLVEQAMSLPDGIDRLGKRSWFGDLDPDLQSEVLAFFDAVQAGKLSRKFQTLRGACRWLSQEIEKKTGQSVKHRTIEEWARQRRPK